MGKNIILEIDNNKFNALLLNGKSINNNMSDIEIKLLKKEDFIFFEKWFYNGFNKVIKKYYVKDIVIYGKNLYRNKKISKINGKNIEIPFYIFLNCYIASISNNDELLLTINFDYYNILIN